MSTVIFTASTKIFNTMAGSLANGENQPFAWSENAKGEIIVRKRKDDGKFCRVPASRVAVFHEEDAPAAYNKATVKVLDDATDTPKTKATTKKKK